MVFLALTVLSGCKTVDISNGATGSIPSSGLSQSSAFKGERGEFVAMGSDGVSVSVADVSDAKAHFFNTVLPNGKEIFFFVVKSSDGKLRAAANGCQVCGSAMQGFHQEGDFMVCNTCGNSYPLNKIATEKGGCNPAPISPDLKESDGRVLITLAELEGIQQFFYK